MRVLVSITICLFLLAGICAAAGIDGKWSAERKIDRGGETMVIKQTFDLKSEGAKLTGKITMQFGDMEPRTMEIKNGKVDGNRFSFATTMSTPNGDFTSTYEGTVEGDTLKGTVTREGGEPRPFEAKRQ